MRITKRCFYRGAGALLFLAFASFAVAQQQAAPGAPVVSSSTSPAAGASTESAAMDALAAKMAEAIAESKQKSVVVLDFANADGKVTPLGHRLAGEFSDALAKAAVKFTVETRPETPLWKSSLYYVDSGDIGFEAAKELNARVALFGRVALEGERLKLIVEARRVDNGKSVKGLQVSLPATPGLFALAQVPKGSETFPEAGSKTDHGSYGFPACIYCPQPEPGHEAVKGKDNPKVVMTVVVDVDGTAKYITVEKQVGYGLDEKAIEAVLKWKLKPAIGPDELPAAVRVPVEVSFQALTVTVTKMD